MKLDSFCKKKFKEKKKDSEEFEDVNKWCITMNTGEELTFLSFAEMCHYIEDFLTGKLETNK